MAVVSFLLGRLCQQRTDVAMQAEWVRRQDEEAKRLHEDVRKQSSELQEIRERLKALGYVN